MKEVLVVSESMRKLIIAAVILLVLSNVMVLAGVAWNRSGKPLTSVELTERELPVSYSYAAGDENSGKSLALSWSVIGRDDPADMYYGRGNPFWLDSDKLASLGFDIMKLSQKPYRDRLFHESVKAVVVLEYDGHSYQQALITKKAKVTELRKMAADFPNNKRTASLLKSAVKGLTTLRISHTRLYAVDAGQDVQQLLNKYKTKGRYLFVPGEIGLTWEKDKLTGRIRQLFQNRIHAPLPFSQMLVDMGVTDSSYAYRKTPIPPRYRVKLSFGKRLEPWIESIEKTDTGS